MNLSRTLRSLGVLAAVCLAVPAMAKSPTKLVSYVVEAKIFTKFLFENNGAGPTEGFQGNVNGVATEYEMNVRGYVSDKVEAFVRVQSRLGADWSDYFLQCGDNGSSEGGPPCDDADYMKFRGATVKLKNMPLPTSPTLWIGSSDMDMFSAFTIGRIRYTERDNAKGVFVRGQLGPGTYDIGRISLPRLWSGPNFNTGNFTVRDFGYGAAYDVSPADGFRLELFGSYVRDNEVLGTKDGNEPFDGGIGGVGTSKYTPRYQNTVGSFEVTYDAIDNVFVNVQGAFSSVRNNAGLLPDKTCCAYSPILHPTPDDPLTSDDEGESLSGGLGIARVELYNVAGSALSIQAEGFYIGENFTSIMSARRETDMLLTQGFSHDIGNPNFGNNIERDGISAGDSHQTVSLAADNGFIDWNESIAETIIGWQGFTIVPKYETGRLRVDGEVSFIGYNTNEQGRDMRFYPDFEFVGGGSFGIVESTGTSRDVRDVYNKNQDRSSKIFAARGNYKLDLFRTSDVTASFKYVDDKDGVDTSISSDDYKGRLMEFGGALRSQINSELELTLGAKIYRYQEDNALRVERPWDPATRGAAFAEIYDTNRDRIYAKVLYRFGAADIAYHFDYFNQTRDIVADGSSFTQELKGRMKSVATVSVGF